MILLLAGTSDARELALAIQKAGIQVLATVVTETAAKSLDEAGISVLMGRLTSADMARVIKEKACQAVVDASHPFADEASKNALAGAKEAEVPYIRYERESQRFQHPMLTVVSNYEDAAKLAASKQGVIMLTTGSKTLGTFAKELVGLPNTRMMIRMLPRVDNLEKCAALGIEQKDIIAMQGPFSKELNQALYRQFGVTLMITKESGKVGSVDEKIAAALECGIETIMIARPKVDYSNMFTSFQEIIEKLNHTLSVRGGINNGF
ncbi:precorrin-6A reductase [Bacillus tuaregi]|uniref:precorrin-6A reductase n=1 Tax=Bacillus tuaregi TaxID=1816695 RepID=UPI0008F8C360|nr:precorrin-6A reductase [Bacillus tuaregi]